MRRLLGAVLVAGVVLAAAGGIVTATIPSGDGTIHACYQNSTGALRVIDGDLTTCPSGFTSLTWNQTGPPGEPGASGVSEYEIVQQHVDGSSSAPLDATASCPEGKSALGVGVRGQSSGADEWDVQSSYPIVESGVAVGWTGRVLAEHSSGGIPLSIDVWAICARVG